MIRLYNGLQLFNFGLIKLELMPIHITDVLHLIIMQSFQIGLPLLLLFLSRPKPLNFVNHLFILGLQRFDSLLQLSVLSLDIIDLLKIKLVLGFIFLNNFILFLDLGVRLAKMLIVVPLTPRLWFLGHSVFKYSVSLHNDVLEIHQIENCGLIKAKDNLN